MDSEADFSRDLTSAIGAAVGSVSEPHQERVSMTFAASSLTSRLSLVATYAAFGFVGAIVLGMF
jgi:hypothetical protein